MKWKLDYGDPSSRIVVAMCECGWRGVAVSREAAMERLVNHEKGQHPKSDTVRAAVRKHAERVRARAGMSHPPAQADTHGNHPKPSKRSA